MEQKFKSGDLVMLKSGGPKMTVREYSNSNLQEIFCDWFVGSKMESKKFHQETLEKAEK